MNRNDEKKTRRPNPIVKASFLSKFTYWWVLKHFLNDNSKREKRKTSALKSMKFYFAILFRWLNPILKIGLKRTIQDDDIYTVTEHMQSARNTDAYIKQWMRELEQQNPSILRVIFKLHLYKLMIFAFLFASLETVARYGIRIGSNSRSKGKRVSCRAHFTTHMHTNTQKIESTWIDMKISKQTNRHRVVACGTSGRIAPKLIGVENAATERTRTQSSINIVTWVIYVVEYRIRVKPANQLYLCFYVCLSIVSCVCIIIESYNALKIEWINKKWVEIGMHVFKLLIKMKLIYQEMVDTKYAPDIFNSTQWWTRCSSTIEHMLLIRWNNWQMHFIQSYLDFIWSNAVFFPSNRKSHK